MGTGSSIVLMPILVVMFGPQQAVPIMAVAALMGNLGRVIAWWDAIDWRACLAYCATAVPAAVIGARTLLAIPPGVAESALGLFFLGLIAVRRWLAYRSLKLTLVQLALLGAPLGLLTGIVVSTGPLTVPLFTFHGLERGGLLGTEAAASIGMYLGKVITFQVAGALSWIVFFQGVGVGSTLMAGSFIGKRVVLALAPAVYRLVIDGLLLVSGVVLLWMAVR